MNPSILLAATLESSDVRLKLRNETATNYSNPESHLKLARYHFDSGNKVQAFYIAEYARKMFGDEEFEPAFQKIASVKLLASQEFDNEEKFNEYCQSHPESFEAYIQDLGKKLEKSNSVQNQINDDQLIEKALSTFPQHYLLEAMAAKYYLKTRKNEEKALPLYIDLYFHNPHFYDWEYAEFRIKQITSSLKSNWYESRQKSKIPLIQIVEEERNPRVLDVILHEAREKWNPSMVQIMLKMLDNDDPSVQSIALHILLEHPDDLSNTNEIRAMITGNDYVRRSIAAFIVVKCLGRNEFSLLKDNLDSGIELVQLDTIQALSMMGGETGREYLREHKPAKATEKMMKYWQEQAFAKGATVNE